MSISLEQLLTEQLLSQLRRGGSHPGARPPAERMEFVREQTLGAVAELMEALNESGWKSWKSRGFGETDKERTADELADVFIFVTNLALAAGLTWRDLDGGIRRAWFKNDEREKNGY